MPAHRLASFALACGFCAGSLAISSRAAADSTGVATDLDNTAWHSSDCHFDTVTFYSAIGVSLDWTDDESMMGWEESFVVNRDQHTVKIVADTHTNGDPVTDSFSGTYTLTPGWTSGTLVGDHSWKDESGQHEQRCSYTLTKRWTD